MLYFQYIIFILLFLCSKGYKILLFNPRIGHSHVNFMSQFTRILVNAGHEVTVLSSNIDDTLKEPYHLPGYIYYTEPHPNMIEVAKGSEHVRNLWKSSEGISGNRNLFKSFLKAKRDQGISMINDKKLENFITNQNFDVAIAESLYVFMFGLFKHWKIETTIVTASTVMFDPFYPMFGIPFPTSYVPSGISGYSDKMSYKERATNLITHWYCVYFSEIYSRYNMLEDVFDEKYGVGYYDPYKIMTNASFFLINSNPLLDIPTPKSPKMIDIGGIGIPKPESVNETFNEILNRRNKTILISFGSIAKSTYMDQEMKDEILKTIQNFPDITFIWKYETPEDGHGSGIENLVLSKWVPQNDLLNDKRLTLFVTHAGIGSTTEVAFSKVPALAIPVAGDQRRNGKLLERLKIGIVVEKEILKDSKKFGEKILEVLNNKEYEINSIKTAEMLRNRPIPSEKLLVKHIEFACKFGQLPRLDLASKDMGVIEYYNLDIIIPFFTVCFFIIYLIIKLLLKIIYKFACTKEKND
uniref:glucuronosyltransferase n=1 Tax=Strongyloides venezuelensis TaxID=75913 RepID=A0A0K0FNY5_STRVS